MTNIYIFFSLKVVKAHKIFLAQGSPVFHAMLFGKMTQAAVSGDKNDMSTQNVELIAIPDLTPTSFKDLLQLVYLH